jgi:hypothetical protein
MRNYISMGFGVNSVALYLDQKDKGVDFEAVYVDLECDWPETKEYVEMFCNKYPVTIIKPGYVRESLRKIYDNLYDYCIDMKIIPYRTQRWCTANFKVIPLLHYFQTPCFVLIGIDAGESHRAKLSSTKGTENRFPLIEDGIDRNGCIEIIKSHGLPVPVKSGCWFCPFQRVSEFRKLRRLHPDLFCKAVEIEKNSGKFLVATNTLSKIINEPDAFLFEELAYPPCQCGL